MNRIGNIFKTKKLKNILLGLVVVALVDTFAFSNIAIADDVIKANCGYVAQVPMTGLLPEAIDDEGMVNAKKNAQQNIRDINSFCETLKKLNPSTSITPNQGTLGIGGETAQEYRNRFNNILDSNASMKKKYQELLAKTEAASTELSNQRGRVEDIHKNNIKDNVYKPCGTKYPKGCPTGTQCFSKSTGRHVDIAVTLMSVKFDCINPTDIHLGWALASNGSEGTGESFETNVAGKYTKVTTDELGHTTVETNMHDAVDKPCLIEKMQETYQKNCYSCIIVKTLVETFLSACSQTYDITSEAGVKILTLGSLIWMAFFVLKNISSIVNVEPGAMMNTLSVFLFKVIVAYLLITSGLGVIVKYAVNPFLTAGADFGMALTSTTGNISGAVNPDYAIKVATVTSEDGKEATEIVSADVINKIMLFSQSVDKTVSTNLVIGHALTCHSLNAGAWNLGPFKIVNIWLWICGAFIWFIGFMLTLGICYYLLDISFKLGFAIIAFPVVLGLWPFNVTKGKVMAVFSIVLKSGATFAFLGLITTYTLVMINEALRNIPTLLQNINDGKTQWISDTFDITGPYFLIIVFVYLYSMKLIAATITDYVDKFFKDSVFGSTNPMHGKLTQITDFAKKKAMQAFKSSTDKAKESAKKAATKGLMAASKFVKGLTDGNANSDEDDGIAGKAGSATGKAGGAIKGAGAATQQAGKGVEAAGKGVDMAGKGAEYAGKGTAHGGKGLMSAGKGLTAGTLGVGAIVGVPMMIAGGAMVAGGKTAEVAGKGAQKIGQAMKKSGKTMQKIGKKIEKAGKKIEKVGKDLQFGKGGKDKKKDENNKDDKDNSGTPPKPKGGGDEHKPDDNTGNQENK